MIKQNKKHPVILLVLLLIAISGFVSGVVVLKEKNLNIGNFDIKTKGNSRVSQNIEGDIPKFLDLTSMSDTALYSEVFNILLSPDKYDGATVKVKGIFDFTNDNSKKHTFCIIQDGPKCCSVGIEFKLKETIPFPARGESIILKGKCHVETDNNGKKFVTIINSTLKINDVK